jgi:hypothetical protein
MRPALTERQKLMSARPFKTNLSVVIEMLDASWCFVNSAAKSHFCPFLQLLQSCGLGGTAPGFRCAPPWAEVYYAFGVLNPKTEMDSTTDYADTIGYD